MQSTKKIIDIGYEKMNRTLTLYGLKPGAEYKVWACRDKYENVDEWCSRIWGPFTASKGKFFLKQFSASCISNVINWSNKC